MRSLTFIVLSVLAFGLVCGGSIRKRAAGKDGDDADFFDLDDLFSNDFMKDLENFITDLVKPLKAIEEEYEDKPTGFKDHKVEHQKVNGEDVKVETNVVKKKVNGTEITIIEKTMDGENTPIKGIKAEILGKGGDAKGKNNVGDKLIFNKDE